MEEEENDPDLMLPHMLFDQESHDLICPVCEHPVTGEVILQKRKREFQPVESEGRPHGIQASLHKEHTQPGSSMGIPQDSLADSSGEDEAEMRSALQDQANYELLCPECESCITHEVILQKRKRPTSLSDPLPQRELLPQPPAQPHPGTVSAGRMGDLDNSDEENPPLKRHRRSDKAVADPDQEGRVVRHILEHQRVYDLSCPDCASRITYQVILKPKTNASRRRVGLLEERGRRPRRVVTSSVDPNPWRTRYKREHGHSKPIAVAKSAKLKRDEAQSRTVAKYGAIENKSLAQPLLPVSQQGGEATPPTTIQRQYQNFKDKVENIFGPIAVTYFLTILFLYLLWWLLGIV